MEIIDKILFTLCIVEVVPFIIGMALQWILLPKDSTVNDWLHPDDNNFFEGEIKGPIMIESYMFFIPIANWIFVFGHLIEVIGEVVVLVSNYIKSHIHFEFPEKYSNFKMKLLNKRIK